MTEQHELQLQLNSIDYEIKRLKSKDLFLESAEEHRYRHDRIAELKRQRLIILQQLNMMQIELQKQQQAEQTMRNLEMLRQSLKKPVYKPASTQCPNCMGRRELQYQFGRMVCPYCDSVEQLVIDHYEVNEIEVQMRLKEMQNRQAYSSNANARTASSTQIQQSASYQQWLQSQSSPPKPSVSELSFQNNQSINAPSVHQEESFQAQNKKANSQNRPFNTATIIIFIMLIVGAIRIFVAFINFIASL